jgi:HK97 family phage major capsid protein
MTPYFNKNREILNKSSFYRTTLRGNGTTNANAKLLDGQDSSTGAQFLPKHLSDTIIVEPETHSALRDISTYTHITNLELPRIAFTIDGDDFVDDTKIANEIKMKPSTVKFGRNKFKVFATVSETVLKGTNTNLVQVIESSLKNGIIRKENKVSLTPDPKVGEEHMSFYSDKTKIKRVQGADLLTAIKQSIADLHEDIRDNATILMTQSDYMDIIDELSNGAISMYGTPPEAILGKPVKFTDYAINPIVGDFSYSHFNYDLEAMYETDKDIKNGTHIFAVTAWFDHQIKLSSAFRISEVEN